MTIPKSIRNPIFGLGVTVLLIILEYIVNIGPFVNKIVPCHQNAAYSQYCYITYDFFWLLFLALVTLGFAIVIAVRITALKLKGARRHP